MAQEFDDIYLLLSLSLALLAYLTKYELAPKQLYPVDAIYPLSKIEKNNSETSDYEDDENNCDIVLLYGSQTGTAEKLSQRLCAELNSRYTLTAVSIDIGEYDFSQFQFSYKTVYCFILATYGEGEPTDNAQGFFNFMNNTSSSLDSMKYMVFGLGNHTYTYFNQTARDCDHLLSKKKAVRIGPLGEGDDGNRSTEEDYLDWKESILGELKNHLTFEQKPFEYTPQVSIQQLPEPPVEHKSGPHRAQHLTVENCKELMESGDRRCIHMEVNIQGSKLSYITGDHLMVWPQNSSRNIEEFLKILGLENKRYQMFNFSQLSSSGGSLQFSGDTTLDFFIRHYIDINGVCSRETLKNIAVFSPTVEAREKLLQLTEDKEVYRSKVVEKFHNIATVLNEASNNIPWTNIPFSYLVENLSSLQPRYYSISSSSLASPKQLSITAIVEEQSSFKGVTSNYLYDEFLQSSPYQGSISGSIQRSSFKLPKNIETPIIMIGPGTGVAPFRGFIHERYEQWKKNMNIGTTVLFFGCRRSNEDFLYRQEMQQFSTQFLHLFTAFSRENKQKRVYVQNKIKEHADFLCELIKQDARIYVCGNASEMAAQVESTFSDIFSEKLSMSPSKSIAYIDHLRKSGRYHEDVW